MAFCLYGLFECPSRWPLITVVVGCLYNAASNWFTFCDYKIFADDLEIYANVSSPGDELKLNTAKFFKMSCFSWNTKKNNDYYIFIAQLVEINKIQDLGMVYQLNVSFSFYIEYFILCSKAFRSLVGFLIHNTKEFTIKLFLKTLYTTTQEYWSAILFFGIPHKLALLNLLRECQERFSV